ncbi:hypothetical protein Hypma_000210 [Hypsizygus marmoreus]|uniref:Uncharacterized protein n=1 Tax=Hypsizygus marmoreus TaxID=39966 RepID=A0A369J949_HYPMA|nr:hypothetical protein Hypma_000210 [Hypsizygus marmoreus]
MQFADGRSMDANEAQLSAAAGIKPPVTWVSIQGRLDSSASTNSNTSSIDRSKIIKPVLHPKTKAQPQVTGKPLPLSLLSRADAHACTIYTRST